MKDPVPNAMAAAHELYPCAKDWDFMRVTDIAQVIERAAIRPEVERVAEPLARALERAVEHMDMLGPDMDQPGSILAEARAALRAYREGQS